MYSKIKSILIINILLFISTCVTAQSTTPDLAPLLQHKRVPNQPLFKVNNPDYKLSPYTGMTREHWKQAGLYLLKGAFSYIDKLDDPMQFPKLPGKSYPVNADQVPTEKLEGLCRTLFIAAPLLKEDPNLVINNIKVADYYRYQISKLLDPASPTYIKPRDAKTGPTQNLVEFGGLAVSLFAIPELLWNPLPQQTKDALATTMLSYGDGPSYNMNWRFFNVFVLSFFKDKGYSVNEKLLLEYVDKQFEHYRGNGWYQDGLDYDYYSMWAFQMYGPLWANFFGKKYYPERAQKFLNNFKDVNDNYPYMFSRNGEMIMWGRSISYRIGSVIPFPLMGMVQEPGTNYGWMRRIASGVLEQVLTNPDLMQDNIPTLGVYGAFDPAVQPYSCRGSVFWMGKAFLGLLVPKDSPFWTAKENEGAWDKELQKGKVYNKFQSDSNILITDYPNIGAAEIRSWGNSQNGNSKWREASESYNRLSYNTAFVWQADSPEGIVSMSYAFKKKENNWETINWYTFKEFKEGVYYRDGGIKSDKNIQMSLADIPIANGILRIDKFKGANDSVQFRLGHYALPQLKGEIKKTYKKVKGNEVCIIDNGVYQLAMVSLKGWKKMGIFDAKGLNPVSGQSTVINTEELFVPGKNSDNVYVTLMLWKKSGDKWTDNELVPVKNINQSANKMIVTFEDGSKKLVDIN